MMPKLASWLLSVIIAMPLVVDGWLGVYLDPEHDAPRVREFVPGSPAEAAGMKAGDVILSVEGKETPDVATLLKALGGTRAGQKVAIRVQREEKELTLAVTLGEKPQGGGVPAEPADAEPAPQKGRPPVPAVEQEPAPQSGRPALGVSVTEEDGSLRVTRVVPDSPADRAGLEDGDQLLRVNDVALGSLQALQELLAQAKGGAKLAFVVARDGTERNVEVELPAAPLRPAQPPMRERNREPREPREPVAPREPREPREPVAPREPAPILRDYDAAMAAAEESGLAAFVVYGDERDAKTQSQLRAIERDSVQSALPGYVVVYVDQAMEPELFEEKRFARLPAFEIVRGGKAGWRHDGFLPAVALRTALLGAAGDSREVEDRDVQPAAGSEVEALRAEVEDLRAEVKRLRSEIDAMRSRQRFR